VNPGESKVEPSITPSSTITLQYGSIDEMGDAGCESRFNGGMHFYDSVPAGIELCSGIGNHGVDGTFSLSKVECSLLIFVFEGAQTNRCDCERDEDMKMFGFGDSSNTPGG